MSRAATGSQRSGGIACPGKGWPVTGSRTGILASNTPLRSASVGTVDSALPLDRMRSASMLPK